MDYGALAAKIKQWGRALGFQAVGIADTDLAAAEGRLAEWLRMGWQGEMDYMAHHGTLRSRPAELVPGTQRVISCRMDYAPDDGAEYADDGRSSVKPELDARPSVGLTSFVHSIAHVPVTTPSHPNCNDALLPGRTLNHCVTRSPAIVAEADPVAGS